MKSKKKKKRKYKDKANNKEKKKRNLIYSATLHETIIQKGPLHCTATGIANSNPV